MNYFEPSARHARGLRWAMDKALWESARDLLAEIGVDAPPPQDRPHRPSTAPTHLLDYAAYFDLDACVRSYGECTDEVKQRAVAHLARRLAEHVPLEPVANRPRVSSYDTAHYTPDQLQQISRWWDTEPANRMALTSPSDEEVVRSTRAIDTAMRHLRAAAPVLHAEVELVVRDIVLAKPDGSQLINYGGASSFGLWGAITVNVETQCDWTQFYRQIVHETGHNLLFAIARDEPLVKADPSVRRRSPIREDARPLDGIFHAAYVSAREAVALEALLQWNEGGGELSGDDVDLVADTLELSVLAFWECIETLRGDPDGPTELGSGILENCEEYMSQTFALEPC